MAFVGVLSPFLVKFVCLSFRISPVKMVKEKPNSIRLYDEDGFRRRAACICVRSDAESEVTFIYFAHCKPGNDYYRFKSPFAGR